MNRKPRSVLKTLFYFAMALAVSSAFYPVSGGEESVYSMHGTAASGLLDGKRFEGPTGEKGKKEHHVDTLIFEEGRFTSTACFEYGFESGPYTATAEDGTVRFKAVTLSPTHGKMEWSGTLRGEELEVDYNWTKERWLWTTFREYWFKGSLVK